MVFFVSCQKDSRKTAGPILMKLGGRVYHGPKKNPLFFRVGLNHRLDTEIIFLLLLTLGDGALGLSGINAIHLQSSRFNRDGQF